VADAPVHDVDGRTDGSTSEAEPLCASDGGCAPRFFVIDVLDIGRADPEGDPEVVPGTNVDGEVTPAGADPSVCTNKEDHKSPPPDNESGVDNEFGPMMAGLSSLGSFDPSSNIAASIADGSLILLLQVDGVDDTTFDRNIEVGVFAGVLPSGVTAPTLAADGRFEPGQTFDIDPASLSVSDQPLITMKGYIDAGRATVEAGVLPLVVAVGPDVDLRLNVRMSTVRFSMNDTGLADGVIGGGLNIEELLTAFEALMLESVSPTILRGVLETAADLERDSEGYCQTVSTGFVFEAVPAVRGSRASL
jgi:hypothetical protein